MTEKTVIISKFDAILNVSSKVAFNKVISNETEGLIEEESTVEYDSLTAPEKATIDAALLILESKLPA